MAEFPETSRAYAAGLFDGEECVELFMRLNGKSRPDGSLWQI